MNTNFRTALATLALVAAAGLAACSNDKTETATTNAPAEAKATATTAAVNKTCPFTGGAANASVTSTCQGKTVAFCCAGCKGKFDKMDAKQQADLCTRTK